MPAPSVEEARPEFSSFLNTLKEHAVAAGVSVAVVERALSGLEPLEIVVERDRSQPEIVLTTDQYVQRRLTRAFVRTATEKAREHHATVSEIAKKYGMDRRVIIAIWGMESNFGR
ncbi:MAG: lytic murein transglycosylase, partial [Acidimicrobiia bacterium]